MKVAESNPPANGSNPRDVILIVGAGLGGLATSLGLASKGFQVEIFEKRHDWARQGSALGLGACGRKALYQILDDEKALDELLQDGIYTGEYFDSHLFGWWQLRNFLIAQVESNPNITIHMGMSIESYDDSSDLSCIQATFKHTPKSDGDCDEEKKEENVVWKGQLLIGADGVYSTVRALLGLEPAKNANKTHWRGALKNIPEGSILEPLLERGFVPLRQDPSTQGFFEGLPCLVSLFNFHPKQPRQMSFVFSVEGPVEPGTRPQDVFDEYCHAKDVKSNPYHDEIVQEMFRLADDEDLRRPLPKSVISLPESGEAGWGGKGRVTLIGDSAHAMRPPAGLGGSMAFEDALVLTRLLLVDRDGDDGLFKSRASTEAFIRAFETSRFDRVKRLWDDQWAMSESAYGYSKDQLEWTPEFRKWVMDGV